jgi:hypothetical protein
MLLATVHILRRRIFPLAVHAKLDGRGDKSAILKAKITVHIIHR